MVSRNQSPRARERHRQSPRIPDGAGAGVALRTEETSALSGGGAGLDEVLLAEAAIRLRARCHWLRQRHRNVGLLACQNLGAVEVAAIGDDIEMVSTKNAFRLRCDVGKL